MKQELSLVDQLKRSIQKRSDVEVVAKIRELEQVLIGEGSDCCGSLADAQGIENLNRVIGSFLAQKRNDIVVYLRDCGLSTLMITREYNGEINVDFESISSDTRTLWHGVAQV